jgi:hypothetical protein
MLRNRNLAASGPKKERWDEKERRAGYEVWNTGNQEGKKREKERKKKEKKKSRRTIRCASRIKSRK